MIDLLKYLLMVGRKTNQKLQKDYDKRSTSNPLPYRLSLLLSEFIFHLAESIKNIDEKKIVKEHLTILYHDGVMINEMYTMIRRTENQIALKTEVNAIQEGLSQLVSYVIEFYGEEETKYIIPSYFQQLSGLWDYRA